ncbi:MAG: DUF3073 domain-containing protein [Mycobacteriales bacterium]
MGRGRAKAKQTKVARALKYSTTATDLERLQRELAGAGEPGGAEDFTGADPDDDDDDDEEEDLAR